MPLPQRTFRRDFVALDAQTGKIIWQTYGLPDNLGVPGLWAGAAIIAPPAVDQDLGLVFGTYGNLYNTPPDVTACNAGAPNGFSESCIPRARTSSPWSRSTSARDSPAGRTAFRATTRGSARALRNRRR